MPIYTFENPKTGEEFTKEMKIVEMEEFLTNNPDIKQIFKTLNIGDPIKLGIKKPPADFQKNVLGRIKENTGKYGNVERKFGPIVREW